MIVPPASDAVVDTPELRVGADQVGEHRQHETTAEGE